MYSNVSNLEKGNNAFPMENIPSNSSQQDKTSHLLGDSSTESSISNKTKKIVGIGIGLGFLGSIPFAALSLMLLKEGLKVTNSNVGVGVMFGSLGGWVVSSSGLILFSVVKYERKDDEDNKKLITLIASSAIGAFVGALVGVSGVVLAGF